VALSDITPRMCRDALDKPGIYKKLPPTVVHGELGPLSFIDSGDACLRDSALSKDEWRDAWTNLLFVVRASKGYDDYLQKQLAALLDILLKLKYFVLQFPVVARTCYKARRRWFSSFYEVESLEALATIEGLFAESLAELNQEAVFAALILAVHGQQVPLSARTLHDPQPGGFSSGQSAKTSASIQRLSSGLFRGGNGPRTSNSHCLICGDAHVASLCTGKSPNGYAIATNLDGRSRVVRKCDNLPFCFNFNVRGGCTTQDCNSVHECSLCRSTQHGTSSRSC
jgi:hypothetical protein